MTRLRAGYLSMPALRAMLGMPEPRPHPFRFEPHGTGRCTVCGSELVVEWHL